MAAIYVGKAAEREEECARDERECGRRPSAGCGWDGESDRKVREDGVETSDEVVLVTRVRVRESFRKEWLDESTVTRTDINIEKQKPYSAHFEEKHAGRCLPSFSTSGWTRVKLLARLFSPLEVGTLISESAIVIFVDSSSLVLKKLGT